MKILNAPHTRLSTITHRRPLALRQRGLTLIEMVIAAALSITLLAGVYQIYNGNKRTYTLQDELARMQENARFAMEFISQDIRKAGFTGCMRGSISAQNDLTPTQTTFDPFSGLQGWEAVGTEPQSQTVDIDPVGAATVTTNGTNTGWQELAQGNSRPSSPLADITTALPASDIIRIWFAGTQAQPVTSINSTTVTLDAALDNFTDGDVAVVSDCGRVDYVMQCGTGAVNIAAVGAGTGCNASMGSTFFSVDPATASARKLGAAIYYVGKTGATGTTNTPPSLFKIPLSGNVAGSSELVTEGVENMQILYGEDNGVDNIPDQYLTADNVTDWNKIVTVKISLLMSTANNVTAKNYRAGYELNGVTLKPAKDRRIRRVYSSTITLRNRV